MSLWFGTSINIKLVGCRWMLKWRHFDHDLVILIFHLGWCRSFMKQFWFQMVHITLIQICCLLYRVLHGLCRLPACHRLVCVGKWIIAVCVTSAVTWQLCHDMCDSVTSDLWHEHPHDKLGGVATDEICHEHQDEPSLDVMYIRWQWMCNGT